MKVKKKTKPIITSGEQAMKKFMADIDAFSPAFAMLGWSRNEINDLKNGIESALHKLRESRR